MFAQSRPPREPNHNNPQPSWRVCDPSDIYSCEVREINKAHVRLALAFAPDMDDCISDVSTRLGARLGMPEYRALTLVEIGRLFDRFPSLVELGNTGAYSLEIWRNIADSLECVDDDVVAAMEPEVYQALLPTQPNQAMWSPTTLRRRMKHIVNKHDHLACPKDLDEDPQPPEDDDSPLSPTRLNIDDRDDQTTDFFLTLPKLEAQELTAALDNVRKKENCSRAEALLKIVRGQTTAEIHLNLYRRVDLPDSQIWAAGTWLNPLTTKKWMKRITHLQAPGFTANNGYAPSPIVRASVEGRDGTCRFPGCDVPAHKCQLDHVQRYNHDNPADGGPTSTSNLHCLCAKHHNAKTAGSWDVTINQDGVEVWTSHGDGHQVITAPNGPLGRETFRQRAVRRTLTLAEFNRRKSQRIWGPLPEDPPY